MNKKNPLQISITAIVVAVALGLLVARAVLADSIDPTDKWAWGTNAGWLNFAPAVGSTDTSHATTVYADHLEGYAWGENIGWIHLGTPHTGGGAPTYGNTSNTDYGVNRDASGNLSGFAWSSSVGWIKFNPTNGGVTIDSATGNFDGWAWGENIGWIRVRGSAANGAAYGVTTCVDDAAAAPADVTPKRDGVDGADLLLSWTDNAAANEGGYQVYRSTVPGLDTWVASLPAGSESYPDLGVVNSTNNYTYIVRGVNRCGTVSPDSPRVGIFHFPLVPGS